MLTIDLNCDLGESFGRYDIGNDKEILDIVSSANIACGYHAGDPTVMRKTVNLALKKNAKIGAHPGFNDLAGFGRREIKMAPQEIFDLMIYQIGAIQGFVKAAGGRLNHVKPHGALYNMAARDLLYARAIAEAVYKIQPDLILYGLAGSELIKAGKELGIHTANEVFADRTYQRNGSLTPRTQENSMIEDKDLAVSNVLSMIKNKKVKIHDGSYIPIEADTICIHGDGPSALLFAVQIKKALELEGIEIRGIQR
ncbi:LamB/YcsF family protein [Actinomycetes bacterium NPDC127524]